MEKTSMNPEQLNGLLKTVGKKLGIPPDQLRSALESGQLQEATRNMRPEDSKKLQSVLGNRAQMEKLMKSPQAKALYEKLTGKKSS
ncbi:MAG: hypothetical protein ACI4JQ_02740 [Ruminococcus sp.]